MMSAGNAVIFTYEDVKEILRVCKQSGASVVKKLKEHVKIIEEDQQKK